MGMILSILKCKTLAIFVFPYKERKIFILFFDCQLRSFFFFFPFFSRAIPRLQVSFSSSPLLAEEKRKDIESFGYEVS